jgi:hypothetical protein
VCAVVGDALAQAAGCIEDGTSLADKGVHARRMLAVCIAGLCYGPKLLHMYVFMEPVLPINSNNMTTTTGNNKATTTTASTTTTNNVVVGGKDVAEQ